MVPAPGEPAAVANDPGKPHSLFHAFAALAKRTRWLRGLLETHNHDNRYYTKAEIDARRIITTWANFQSGAPSPPNGVYVEFTAPFSGYYLLEGHAVWQCWGAIHWRREIFVDGTRIYDDGRDINGGNSGAVFSGSWADQKIVQLAAGAHVARYTITTTVSSGAVVFLGNSMIKVTML